MADTGEIFYDVSSESDTCSACLSAVETKADAGCHELNQSRYKLRTR
jgi:hypothetical protein